MMMNEVSRNLLSEFDEDANRLFSYCRGCVRICLYISLDNGSSRLMEF